VLVPRSGPRNPGQSCFNLQDGKGWQKKRVNLNAVNSAPNGAAIVRVIRALAGDLEQVTGKAWSTVAAPPSHKSIFEIVSSTNRYGG
jgi:hypothetical protein